MTISLEITGPNLVKAAISSPFVQIQSIETNEHFYNVLALEKLQKKNQVKIYKIDHNSKSRDKISAKIHFSPFYNFDEEFFTNKKTILYLDHLSDPQNVGNAIRHAVAFNVDAIILPQHKSCPINETVARASVGTLFQVPMLYISGVNPFLKNLQALGFGLIGTSLENAVSFTPECFWPKTIISVVN